MASVVKKLYKAGAIRPEPFVSETVYEVQMGSVAYGVSQDTSDIDVYAICVPPKTVVFPHLTGEIEGFGKQKKRFGVFQQHHIPDHNANGKEYDVCVYNIIEYFQLCMNNNPNMVDSLFVPDFCVLHSTEVGNHIRTHRKMFLSKKSWNSFKGYSFAQLHKAMTKNPEGKRREIVERYGWDVKFGYHVVRLLDEAEQILTFGDLDLQRSREHLKAIRAGEVSFEQVKQHFEQKEKSLEELYHSSTAVPYTADESVIKNVLLQCLEISYGSLDNCLNSVRETAPQVIKQIKELISKNGF